MNYLKEPIKKIFIILITVIIVIATIFCVFYFKNKTKKETQVSLPIENNIINENVENIERIIVVLNPKNTYNESPTSNAADDTTENNTINNTQNNTVNNVVTNPTPNNSNTNSLNYYIKVNYGANVVTIYVKDNDGNYTIPYKAMICSTGTATPKSGVYPIQLRWEWLKMLGSVYGHYTTQIVGNILFHSVPYLEKGNPASLEYWEYDKLGTSASAGCIRLKVEDAIWIYNNCPSGTLVEFYSSSEPGPLGKPTAPKISGYDSPYKNWDPTDPNSSNPWITNPPENSASN